MKKIFLLFLFYFAALASLRAQQAIDNDSICKMVKAGLSDDVMIATITATGGRYDLSDSAVAILKKASVSDKVIEAITEKTRISQAAPLQGNAAGPVKPAIDTRSAPRVFLTSENSASSWGSQLHGQATEIAKLFGTACPTVVIATKSSNVEYTMFLIHTGSLFSHENQMQISDRNGNVIAPPFSLDPIQRIVKHACDAITSDWTAKYAPTTQQRATK
jgi:hypothetical protein